MSKIAFEDLEIYTNCADLKLTLGRLYTTQGSKDLVLLVEKLEGNTSFKYKGIYLNAGVVMFLTDEGRVNHEAHKDSNTTFDLTDNVDTVEVNLPVTISGYFKEEDCSTVEFRVQDTGLNSIDLYCEEVMVTVTNLITATLKAKYHELCIKELLQ